MKKIRKIIISFGIVLMGFAKKVLADMPEIPANSRGATAYGVTSTVYNILLSVFEVFLALPLIPIIFVIGFSKRRSLEKRIDSIDKDKLKFEKSDAKDSCIGNIFFSCIIIIIQYILWFLSYLESKPKGYNNVFEKIWSDFLDAPVMISLGLILLLVMIFMTKSKGFEASYKKRLLNISSICMILSFLIGVLLFFIRAYSAVNMIIFILFIENIFVSIQTYQYKTKLISERLK